MPLTESVLATLQLSMIPINCECIVYSHIVTCAVQMCCGEAYESGKCPPIAVSASLSA
jgi:hypothetical protein